MNTNSTYEINPESDSFCVISGILYCSNEERLDRIKEIYQICDELGIDTILNCGNLVSSYVREDLLPSYAYNTCLDYVINNHPYSKNIKMYSISGANGALVSYSSAHKPGNYARDINEEISKNRDDIIHIGYCCRKVRIRGLNIYLYSNAKDIKDGFSIDHEYPKHSKAYIEKEIKANPNTDLVCVGPNDSVSHYMIGNTKVLNIGNVSDYGTGYHPLCIVDVKPYKKKVKSRVMYYPLKTSYK